ncbi:MAG TPA: 1-(5-phosphoribosyl)-5-[(5-phosphoribosylamino)methylideneamino]imidazole-4-carboxamide isomerase [Actinomycetota bacterium]|nr:1-(5-phosphoribosyl)-5-[(5-phosphoribosylamino)methylideneamino]imidazole-4-carboxamide isomerase [Actinomycetota bacterium]
MIVVPAIDLRGGRAVRLTRGRPDDEIVYGDDPVAVAEGFVGRGAAWLHLVDLDAALRVGSNRDVVRRVVAAAGIPVQVGGGLRSPEDVEAVLQIGAARAIVGTAAATGAIEALMGRFGDRLVVALDTEGHEVRVRGWTEGAGDLERALRRLQDGGAARFLITAIRRDGTLEGPDVALYERVLRITDRPVLASGGVRSSDDVRALAGTGVEGAIVGKALYEGTLDLREAVEAAS